LRSPGSSSSRLRETHLEDSTTLAPDHRKAARRHEARRQVGIQLPNPEKRCTTGYQTLRQSTEDVDVQVQCSDREQFKLFREARGQRQSDSSIETGARQSGSATGGLEERPLFLAWLNERHGEAGQCGRENETREACSRAEVNPARSSRGNQREGGERLAIVAFQNLVRCAGPNKRHAEVPGPKLLIMSIKSR
jgi:hypothetical protein